MLGVIFDKLSEGTMLQPRRYKAEAFGENNPIRAKKWQNMRVTKTAPYQNLAREFLRGKIYVLL